MTQDGSGRGRNRRIFRQYSDCPLNGLIVTLDANLVLILSKFLQSWRLDTCIGNIDESYIFIWQHHKTLHPLVLEQGLDCQIDVSCRD